jgi:hypothetical protein
MPVVTGNQEPPKSGPGDDLTDVLGQPDSALLDVLGEPELKKKDESGGGMYRNGPENLPSASSPTPTVTATSASKSDLRQNIFGKATDPNTPVDANLFADEKGSLIDRATAAALKFEKNPDKRAAINSRKHELSSRFFSGSLTGEDVDYISEMINPGAKFDDHKALPSDVIANAINNKTKNLRVWSNVAIMNGVDNYNKQLAEVDLQLSNLSKWSGELPPELAQKKKELQTQKDFLTNSFSAVYEAEKANKLPKIAADLKNEIAPGKSFDEIMDANYHEKTQRQKDGLDRAGQDYPNYFLEYDKASQTLTKESTQSVLKFADEWKKKNPNKILNSGPDQDVGASLVNYLNTVPVMDKTKKIYQNEFQKQHPALAPLVAHQQQVQDYFTQEHIKAAESVVKTSQDKQLILTREKYTGKNGIITTNPEFVKIQRRHSEAVARHEETEESAKNQMVSDVNNNPVLQKLMKNYQSEVESIQNKGQQMYADFITNGIEATIDPNLVFYKSGNVGIKGMSEAQSRESMNQYNDGLTKSIAAVFHNQNEALKLDAGQRAKRQQAFGASWNDAAKSQMGALYNWLFHNTGFGGDEARMFQAESLAEIPASQSDVAKAWNWEGLKSLINPKFWASKVSGMVPIMAPSAAMTMLTEGAGLPEAVGWLSSAGVFTAQDMLSFHNSLENTTDKFGRKLTEAEIDNATAEQGQSEYLPNVAFMALNLGTLTRAKGLTKPTVGAAIKEAVVGAAAGTPAMAVQGYLSYANNLKAQGKTPDIWDYMQDDHFATSLVDGFIGGLGIQLAHTPSNYVKSLKNYKTLMAESAAGEFRDNILFNNALQHEMDGRGDYFRDGAKIELINESRTPEEKEFLKQQLQYSTALNRNIKDGNIDLSTIEGAYQAHSLAMADMHDQWAEESKGNKNISKIYSDQAKEFRDQAKNTMEGKGKFLYMMDNTGKPIFISDQSFKNLDAGGQIRGWMDKGLINSIHSSDDPNFNSEYQKSRVEEEDRKPRTAPIEPKFKEGDVDNVIKALKDNRHQFSPAFELSYGAHLENPEQHEAIAKEVVSQAADHQGLMRNMIGEEAFKAIKPILDEQIELAKPKMEDLPPLREKSEAKTILSTEIPDALGRKQITFNGKSQSADAHIEEISNKRKLFDEIIKSCL